MGQFDFWNKEVKEGIKGGASKAFLGLQVAAVVTGENKLKEVLKLVRDLVLWRPMLNMLFVGMFASLGKGIRSLVHDTGSLHAAMSKLRTIQGLEKSLAPFVAGIENAKRKVAELVNFAARKNLSLGEVGGSAKGLAASTRGASGIGDLDKLNDVARSTGNSLADVTEQTGNLYATLRSGDSIASTVEGLRSMGVISQTTADSLVQMQQSAASGPQIWDAYMQSLGRFAGGADAAKDSIEEVTTAHEAAKKALMDKFGSPFVSKDVENTKNWTGAIQAILPAVADVSDWFGRMFQGMRNLTGEFAKWIAESGIAGAALRALAIILSVVAAGASAIGAVKLTLWLREGAVSFANFGAAANWARTNVLRFTGSAMAAEVAAKAVTISMRILSRAMRLLAFVGLVGLLLEIAGAIKGMADASAETIKEMQDLRAAQDEANRSLENQISNIETLTDKHEAFQAALQATQKAFDELEESMKPGQAANYYDQRLANYKKQQELLQNAQGAGVTASPELIREQFEQQESQRRSAEAAAMQAASPEGKIELMKARQERLEERTKVGLAMPEAEEATKASIQDLSQKRDMLKSPAGRKNKFFESPEERSQRISIENEMIQQQENSQSPTDRASGALERIKAAGQLRDMQKNPERTPEQMAILSAKAGQYAEMSPEDLHSEKNRQNAELIKAEDIKKNAKSESEQLAGMPNATKNAQIEVDLANEKAQIEEKIAGTKKTGLDLVQQQHDIAMELLDAEKKAMDARTDTSEAEKTTLGNRRRSEIQSFEISKLEHANTLTSLDAEEKKSALKDRGFNRTRQESAIAIQALDKEIDIENRRTGGPDENRLRDLEARKKEAEIAAGINREQNYYDRQDAGFELQKQKAHAKGNAMEEKRIGYVQEGLHLYQQMRGITDDKTAMDYTKQFMTGKISAEMAQQGMAADQQAAVSSLARIGGGGGVEETTAGDAISIARESKTILTRIEENTRAASATGGYDDTLSQSRRQ